MTTRDSQVYRDDSLEIFLTDHEFDKVVHLAVSASGAQYDALSVGDKRETIRWNADWSSAVAANEKGFATEVAVPWNLLAEAGLDRHQLRINFQINRRYNLGEALMYLGFLGRDNCENFAPLGIGKTRDPSPRKYTVRLHFAELDDILPGDRSFDVLIQGRKKLEAFDIARNVGRRCAVVREFKDVIANETVTIEFTLQNSHSESARPPTLSAIELFEQIPVRRVGPI